MPNYSTAIKRKNWEKHGEIPSVKDFGALGDTKVRTDGSMTSGTAILTTSGGSPFSAVDVGKTICVNGAGASGLRLDGATIVEVLANNQIRISVNASTSVSNTKFTFGTPDHAAFQKAVDNAPNGILRFPRPSPGCSYWVRARINVTQPIECIGNEPKILFDFPLSASTANGMVFYVTSSNVYFRGLWFSQDNLPPLMCYTTRRAFLFSGTSLAPLENVGFTDCRITDFTQYSLTDSLTDPTPQTVLPFTKAWAMGGEFQWCNNVYVENNRLSKSTGYLSFFDSCTYVDVCGNKVDNTMTASVTFNAACYNVLVADNRFTGTGYIGGVRSYWGGVIDSISQHAANQDPNAYFIVRNNFISGRFMYGAAIRFGSIKGLIVTGNVCRDLNGVSTSSTPSTFNIILPYAAAGTPVYFVEDTWSGVAVSIRATVDTANLAKRGVSNLVISDNEFTPVPGSKMGVGVYLNNIDPTSPATIPTGGDVIIRGNRMRGSSDGSFYWQNGVVVHGNNSGFNGVVISQNIMTCGPTQLLAGAICVVSGSASRLLLDCTITENIVKFQEGLGTATGDAVGIQIHQYADRVVCRGNYVKEMFWGILLSADAGEDVYDLDDNRIVGSVNLDIALGGTRRQYKRAVRYSDSHNGGVKLFPGEFSGIDSSYLELGVRESGSSGSARVARLHNNVVPGWMSLVWTDGSGFTPINTTAMFKFDGNFRLIAAETMGSDVSQIQFWGRPTSFNAISRNFAIRKSYTSPAQLDVTASDGPDTDPEEGLIMVGLRRNGASFYRADAAPQARVHIGGSLDGAAETGPLKLDPGVLLGTPEVGTFEHALGSPNSKLFFTVLRADGLAKYRYEIPLGPQMYTANRNLQTDGDGLLVAGQLPLGDPNFTSVAGLGTLPLRSDGTKVVGGAIKLYDASDVDTPFGSDDRVAVFISGALAAPYSSSELMNVLIAAMDGTGANTIAGRVSTTVFENTKLDQKNYTVANFPWSTATIEIQSRLDIPTLAAAVQAELDYSAIATALSSYFAAPDHTHPYDDASGGTVTVDGTDYAVTGGADTGRTTGPPS